MHSVQARHVLFRLASSLQDASEGDSVSLASYSQPDGGGSGSAHASASVSAAVPGVTSQAAGVSARSGGVGKKRGSRKSRQEWDVVEGLKDGQRCDDKPDRFQGYLMKRRKWPMKGWHKRFFVLERGILTYAKSGTDVKDPVLFDQWLKRLRHHRLYRQHELIYGTNNDIPRLSDVTSPVEERPALATANLPELALSQSLKRDTLRQSSFKGSQGRVATWLLDTAALEQTGKSLQHCQSELAQLRNLLEKIQTLPISPDSGLERMDSCDSDVVVRKKRVFRPYKRRERKSDGSSASLLTGSSNKENSHVRRTSGFVDVTRTESHKGAPNSERLTPTSVNISTASSASSTNNASNSNNTTTITTNDNNNQLQSPPQDRLKASASNPNLLQYHNSHTGDTKDLSGSSTNISTIVAAGSGGSGSGHSGRGHGQLASTSSDKSSSLAPHEFRIQEIKLRESFLSSAEGVHSRLRELLSQISVERERLKSALEQESETGQGQVAALKISLVEVQKQNADLRARLARIHSESVVPAECSVAPVLSPLPTLRVSHSHDKSASLVQSLSLDSFSMSEYYDAEENVAGTISDSSSEPSDDEVSSDVSEDGNDTDHTTGGTSYSEAPPEPICATGRRNRLPVPKPESPDVSMWNLLYRNIGKDLTKISMPVTLNEPLSMLQRLCEELEYSELLDKAAEYDDPYERMIYVAAFAVSSYASSYYREGHKPFNPLLGETYECIREDKGWRFIAEQVCHHPPIAACHCESKNFTVWQEAQVMGCVFFSFPSYNLILLFKPDVRIKTKFWGKSMEIQPLGHVHCVLPKFRDHYKWNKVTTCVHNLLGGQRWADQYGEMTITNGNIICKLTFTKGSNNSSPKRYEVYGSITTADGKAVHNLFGKWNEAFFCGHASSAKCIWRPGAMPEDYELYYGFTRFAIELNELDPDQAKFLPPTDTRFRPDQRLMEEGKLAEAESEKHRLENSQRDRRKNREGTGDDPKPLWFRKSAPDGKTETYEYNGKYWDARKDPGFNRMSFLKIF
ncbi:oxysterol-binding protein [Elysia marginata]|uniref:Oxysterol-binding protein n=1 Tax=Elysia marginata TaxID=1093978 RepID=A0AAV4H8P7_9GAST|nr:oxysterol-binding protein [Elysia marginata]